MRFVLLLSLIFALFGCAPRAAPRCDLVASGEIAFTAPNARDIVEARSLGAECGAAVAIFVLRSQDGLPIWAWAGAMHPTFGDSFAPRPAPEGPSRDDVQNFLNRWAEPEISSTSAAPEWSRTLRTSLDRATYEDIRARNPPMLCHLAGVARRICVYWESGFASAGEFYVREPPAPIEEPVEQTDRARQGARTP